MNIEINLRDFKKEIHDKKRGRKNVYLAGGGI